MVDLFLQPTVLITGGSGLVGSQLTSFLKEKGFKVSHLSRKKSEVTGVTVYKWDIDGGFIEEGALKNTDAIIHLAGAGIVDKSWTSKRKEEILKSRIESTALLQRELQKGSHSVKVFVCASAVGIYGSESGDKELNEKSPPGNDFLADVAKKWEAEADTIGELGIRLVKLRFGVVLSQKGGALKKMILPFKFAVGAHLGSGKQYISWVHIDDVCAIVEKAMTDETIQGTYNATAPQPATNKELTQAIAKVLKASLFLPSVPPLALKLLLGEMAETILGGAKVSSRKIQTSGFTFQFPDIDSALKNLL